MHRLTSQIVRGRNALQRHSSAGVRFESTAIGTQTEAAAPTLHPLHRQILQGQEYASHISVLDSLARMKNDSKNDNQGHGISRIRGTGYWADKKRERDSVSDSNENQVSDPTLPPFPESKSISDSYTSFTLPFSKDPALHEVYIGGMTSVRVGRLMEDFDTLAGSIAYSHCLPKGYGAQDAKKFGIYIVTAAVDRLDMLRPISIKEPEDLHLSGYIANVGRSSMSIFVHLTSLSCTDGPQTLLRGRFTMACRSSKTGKSHPVPKLLFESKEEVEISKFVQRLKDTKMSEEEGKKVLEMGPNERESKILHDLFLGEKTKSWFDNRSNTPKNVVWIRDTVNTTALMMHPQERNVHGKIFGGYLMRMAYETAWTTASLFAKSGVNFLSLDELSFHKPVEIGSLLQLTSKIVFSPTEGKHKSFQVNVEATTIKLPSGEENVTNTFAFTFESREYLERYVLPRSYRESIEWLDAMRRRRTGIRIRHLYGNMPDQSHVQ